MNKLLIVAVMFVVGQAWAQDAASVPSQDLGGVGDFISNVAKAARGGTSVDINKHVDGLLYVPYPALHSADGKVEYACLGLGADLGAGVSGTRLHGAPLILPMINLAGATDFLTRGAWNASHLTFPVLGSNLALGVGVKPLPVVGARGKWILGNQLSAALTIGFGKK